MIEIVPMAPALGAEIHGLDLSQGVTPAETEQVRSALDEHRVVFFPDQKLSPEQHVGFGRAFGSLIDKHPPYLAALDGHPEVIVLDGQRGGKADLWHTDITWFERPPAGSILYAESMPTYGGDTMWANLTLAYEALSAPMKRMLEDAVAVHDLTLTIRQIQRERSDSTQIPAGERSAMPAKLPSARHPVVRTHPRTGRKGLFVNSAFTSHIEGMSLKESDTILGFLYEHSVQPEFTVRRHWKTGDVGFWDNICTIHYALADYGDEERRIHRVTLEGEVPV